MKTISYANAMERIMYTMIGTRSYVAYPLGVASMFMAKPIKDHLLAVKWILIFLRGTSNTKLVF